VSSDDVFDGLRHRNLPTSPIPAAPKTLFASLLAVIQQAGETKPAGKGREAKERRVSE